MRTISLTMVRVRVAGLDLLLDVFAFFLVVVDVRRDTVFFFGFVVFLVVGMVPYSSFSLVAHIN